MTPENLKSIKPDMINNNDTIFIMEEGNLVEYKICSPIRQNEYWLECESIHAKSGLETVLKFNPKVQNDIYRSYLGNAWIAMG